MGISKVTNGVRRVLKLKYCGAVIVAAGSASRMEGIDKVMAPLEGEPMIVRTVRTFQNCDCVKEIVVVTREDLLQRVAGLCKNFDKVKAVVVGGKDRAESVNNGLNALSKKVKLVAVQDGARPLITDAVIPSGSSVVWLGCRRQDNVPGRPMVVLQWAVTVILFAA